MWMNKWVEWRGDPFLRTLTHCQIGICGGFLRLYANQKCIKAPVSQQSLQWWIFILVFHFDSHVDSRGETLLLILFLKVVQVCLFVCFPYSPSVEGQLLLCVYFITEVCLFLHPSLPSILPWWCLGCRGSLPGAKGMRTPWWSGWEGVTIHFLLQRQIDHHDFLRLSWFTSWCWGESQLLQFQQELAKIRILLADEKLDVGSWEAVMAYSTCWISSWLID